MTVRRMFDLLKRFQVKPEKKLGRWAIHNHKQTVLKIKHANEDNCGVSGNVPTNLPDVEYIFLMFSSVVYS